MSGDPAQQLEELHPASFGWALACCRWDREEAEEVLQTTYLKVLDGRARFADRSSFRTWLFAVIHRTAAERRRGRWLRLLATARWLNGHVPPAPAATPESAAGESEAVLGLRQALHELPSRQRDVLHLVFYQDLTVEGAARVLGISVGTARTHYHRGKETLRQVLALRGRR
ncbi:MAG TPA: RNA polymerase sigma factor [Thermoanaerobaculia bacterium]|jgi:RNA polymerase sigma-70 factor (ECF subfamily)|nr:RNA polymerase sigma factor [Thermoanaerobaculia bacterium]